MIALGVIAATWLTGRRLERSGAGTRDDVSSIAVVAVPAGVVGARLYHVLTDWERFEGRWLDAFKIWQGGLGVWGGIALGVVVGLWAARRRGVDVAMALTAVAPALPLAQAIGRWGNWFNQELFGRPTTLPWGLEISPQNLPSGYQLGTLFHPTFLYESLGCVVLTVLLLQLDRRAVLRPGRLFAFYVAGYTALRFFVEGLRIDSAQQLAGLRWNQWMSVAGFLVAVVFLVVDARRRRPATTVDAASADSADARQDPPARLD